MVCWIDSIRDESAGTELPVSAGVVIFVGRERGASRGEDAGCRENNRGLSQHVQISRFGLNSSAIGTHQRRLTSDRDRILTVTPPCAALRFAKAHIERRGEWVVSADPTLVSVAESVAAPTLQPGNPRQKLEVDVEEPC
jgi:hypothetical protein